MTFKVTTYVSYGLMAKRLFIARKEGVEEKAGGRGVEARSGLSRQKFRCSPRRAQV